MPDGNSEEPSGESRGTYAKLAAPWPKEEVKQDTRGGVTFDYITGEMCITRLNETFGPAGWSFKVLDHRVDTEADEVVVLAELSARIWTSYEDGTKQWDTVVKQQWGSQKIRRSRTTGVPLDLGFDYKGATTDCLKKCATLYGVALYLTKKLSPEEKHQQMVEAREAAKADEGKARSAGSTSTRGARTAAPASSTSQSPSATTTSQLPGSTPASITSSSTPAPSTTDSATELAGPSTEDTGGQLDQPSTVASLTTELEKVAETDERPKDAPQVSTDSPGPASTPTTTTESTAATTTLPDYQNLKCEFCGNALIAEYTVNSRNGPQQITGYIAAERSKRLFHGVVLDPLHGEMLYKMDPKLMNWWKKEHKGTPVTWGQAVPANR